MKIIALVATLALLSSCRTTDPLYHTGSVHPIVSEVGLLESPRPSRKPGDVYTAKAPLPYDQIVIAYRGHVFYRVSHGGKSWWVDASDALADYEYAVYQTPTRVRVHSDDFESAWERAATFISRYTPAMIGSAGDYFIQSTEARYQGKTGFEYEGYAATKVSDGDSVTLYFQYEGKDGPMNGSLPDFMIASRLALYSLTGRYESSPVFDGLPPHVIEP